MDELSLDDLLGQLASAQQEKPKVLNRMHVACA